MTRDCFALLGRRDEPTDAVEEYCRYLGAALASRGYRLTSERVPWLDAGWPRIRRAIRGDAQKWKGCWVLLQYTALGWSRRAVPLALPRFMRELKRAGAHCAVVFHDAQPYPGSGIVQTAKRLVQASVMRALASRADLAILTVPLEQVRWLPRRGRFAFVPVGANLPIPEQDAQPLAQRGEAMPTVAIFSPTGGAAGHCEARVAADTFRRAAQTLGPIRLLMLGRNSEAAGERIRENLAGEERVRVETLGLLPPEGVVASLSRADAMLFIRGALSTRRGSGIAGIACGLPLIALEGAESAGPVRDAGVLWVAENQPQALAAAVVRLFQEPGLRQALAERSRAAFREHFCWQRIAGRIAREMDRV
jgi:glycosyltransferase involved in cell wall biosynthesis